MWIMQEKHANNARPVNMVCRGTCMVIYFTTVDKHIPTLFNEKHKKNILKTCTIQKTNKTYKRLKHAKNEGGLWEL